MVDVEIDDLAPPSLNDVVEYLKTTRNGLIGNPLNKLQLLNAHQDDGPPLLNRIVRYSYSETGDLDPFFTTTSSVAIQIRIEASNIVASLSHGSNDTVLALISADAPDAMLRSLMTLRPHDLERLKVAVVRAFRALCVATANCIGPALWGLGEDNSEYKKGVQIVMESIFLPDSLDLYLPYLDGPSSTCKQYITEFIAFAVRSPDHQSAVIEWSPPKERSKEGKGKRGWENLALVDASASNWQGGWVLRRLIATLDGKELPAVREATLYALGALAKDNHEIAVILSKLPDSKSVLTKVSGSARDRNPSIRLAACLCITNILRALPSGSHRRLSGSTIQILLTIISNTQDAMVHRMKACHILSTLVADDKERCIDAWKLGTLARLSELITSITPTVKPQEWEDGESVDITRLREAALTAVASVCLFDNDIRNEASGAHDLLPYVAVCIGHPFVGVRYGACLCVRSFTRAVRVLRTSLYDAGIGVLICDVVEKQDEDIRVTNIALAAFANLLNDFSPLREATMERGIIKRIVQLSLSTEITLKTNALCAIRNFTNKARFEEKQAIMNNLGWAHLQTCMSYPSHEVQEQALAILTNIASSESHIDLVFRNVSPPRLMKDLAGCLSSRSDDVIYQAASALGNISNGSDTHYSHMLLCPELLAALRMCVMHSRLDIRKAALECSTRLVQMNLPKLKQAGFEEALQRVCHEPHRTAGPVVEMSEPRSRRLGTFDAVNREDPLEVNNLARDLLRLLDSSGDYPM